MRINFQTDPSRYLHWKSSVDGPRADPGIPPVMQKIPPPDKPLAPHESGAGKN